MIYFVRHGQTEANVRHIFTGNIDFPLTDFGMEQAKAVAIECKGIKFDYIFCSPLLRAKQTMEEIAKFQPDAKKIFDERLKERGDGDLEGEIDERDDERWNMKNWFNEKYGETFESANNRVKSFIEEITKKYPNKNILIVAHIGIGRFFKCYFDGFPKDGNMKSIKVPNAKLIALK